MFKFKKDLLYNKFFLLTFHNINDASNITFFDDKTLCGIFDGVHAIYNFSNLSDIQIFHKIIIQNGRFDNFPRSEIEIKKCLSKVVNKDLYTIYLYNIYESDPINTY